MYFIFLAVMKYFFAMDLNVVVTYLSISVRYCKAV